MAIGVGAAVYCMMRSSTKVVNAGATPSATQPHAQPPPSREPGTPAPQVINVTVQQTQAAPQPVMVVQPQPVMMMTPQPLTMVHQQQQPVMMVQQPMMTEMTVAQPMMQPMPMAQAQPVMMQQPTAYPQ